METLLFEDGFIPDRLHEARKPRFDANTDHNYSGRVGEHTNTSVEEGLFPGSGVNGPEFQMEDNNMETNDESHSSHVHETEIIRPHRVQLFYGLLDLEKTLLQAISTLACDGSGLLDALVYFIVIPMSGMYMIR